LYLTGINYLIRKTFFGVANKGEGPLTNPVIYNSLYLTGINYLIRKTFFGVANKGEGPLTNPYQSNKYYKMEKYYLYCFEFPTTNALLAITEAL